MGDSEMQINRAEYDSWKTRVPDAPLELEVVVSGFVGDALKYLAEGDNFIYDAWRGGERDFPGLDVREVRL